jgi:lipopolysaccharide/colanic/teichoic acid biosynthesis glycosyltransferase
VIEREIIWRVSRRILKGGNGVYDTIIVGENEKTAILADYLDGNLESGYRIVAVVKNLKELRKFLKESGGKAEMIIQTSEIQVEETYAEAVENHLSYAFVPNQDLLLSHNGKMRIFGSLPMVSIYATPLEGWGRVVKRTFDIIIGGIMVILASPIMLILAIIIKLTDPDGPVFYASKRLSRYGKEVSIYKFRSMKNKYSGMSPEEAFEKMGKPELSKVYRENGDQLDNDPRVTKIGKFIRKTSLDELPQLINVVLGDIALIGPRALVKSELDEYRNKNLILSVRSGLTGLAQVSGRRDISFEERRLLDIYYIQNWSLGLDLQIFFKTIVSVLLRRGAK